MRAICHIGHHKTGTTSLQAFLSRNSNALIGEGVLYPWVEFEGAARAHAKARLGDAAFESSSFNVREAHNALAFRMLSEELPQWKVPPHHAGLPHGNQMMRAIRFQLSELEPDTVVLCSEVMSHFGKSAQPQISRLRTAALRSVSDITVWCTLRRPDEQLVSWHGQQLRFGQSPAALSDHKHGLNLDWLHVDYRGVIEPWARIIPEAKIILRPYVEVRAEGGSVEDFFKHADLPRNSEMISTGNLNVGFKPAMITLLRRANKALPSEEAKLLARHVDALTSGMALYSVSEVEFLGEASRARLCAHFKPIHKWLSQVTGRDAFFADIGAMEACLAYSEAQAYEQFLDQLTPERLEALPAGTVREFVAGQRT